MRKFSYRNRFRSTLRCVSMSIICASLLASFVSEVRAAEEPLQQPPEFATDPETHILTTELTVRRQTTSYMKWKQRKDDDGNKTGCYYEEPVQDVNLRMYGYPKPGSGCPAGYQEDNGFCYGFPGPTFRMRRADDATAYPGDQYQMTLHNEFAPNQPMDCRDDNNPYDWDTSPNCFHGAEVTNHHFHGFHVSPNPNEDGTYQDYIYLRILPKNTTTTGMEMANTVEGTAEYKLDALGEGQHEGTHWYHPHKHGSTAVQLGNGMAGALVVEGPYDDWVKTQVCSSQKAGCELKEQVMVVQEILSNFTFPPDQGAPTNSEIMVNGQLYPTVDIAPGEVQRWRVLNAAMKAAAAYYFVFPSALEVVQIGFDGVPFVEANYARQPLLGYMSGDTCVVGGVASGDRCILLQPGNRADFLVKRGLVQPAGLVAMPGGGLEAKAQSVVQRRKFFSHQTRERLPLTELRPATLIASESNCLPGEYDGKPGLFTINQCPGTGDCGQKSMRLPLPTDNYPELSSLADLVPTGTTRDITYNMVGYTGAQLPNDAASNACDQVLYRAVNSAVGACVYFMANFSINGTPFQSDRVDQHMTLGAIEEWRFSNEADMPVIPEGALDPDTNRCPGTGLEGSRPLTDFLTQTGCPGGEAICLKGTVDCDSDNDGSAETAVEVTASLPDPSQIQHPVHLHVNPFQVTSHVDGRMEGPPYVWQDVMGLSMQDGPNTTMNTQFLDFTGEFVMHCHILGHEDRGMMQNLSVSDTKAKKAKKK